MKSIKIYHRSPQLDEETEELLELTVFIQGLTKCGYTVEWHDASPTTKSGSAATVQPQIYIDGELWLQGRYPDIFELSDRLKLGCLEYSGSMCCKNQPQTE